MITPTRRAALVHVLDVRQTERAAAILVAGELADGGGGVLLGSEFDNAGAARASVGLVLAFGALDFADGREELDEVFARGGPGELCERRGVLTGDLLSSVFFWGMRCYTYVAHVDNRARLAARSGEVGEGVGSRGSRSRSSRGTVAASASSVRRSPVSAAAVAAASTEAATKSTTRSAVSASETATPAESSSETATAVASAETATGSAETGTACETILADLEHAPLPVVAVELGNGVLSVIGVVESDDARALGTAVRGNVDVGADDGTDGHSLAEKVLEILPADSVGKLCAVR